MDISTSLHRIAHAASYRIFVAAAAHITPIDIASPSEDLFILRWALVCFCGYVTFVVSVCETTGMSVDAGNTVIKRTGFSWAHFWLWYLLLRVTLTFLDSYGLSDALPPWLGITILGTAAVRNLMGCISARALAELAPTTRDVYLASFVYLAIRIAWAWLTQMLDHEDLPPTLIALVEDDASFAFQLFTEASICAHSQGIVQVICIAVSDILELVLPLAYQVPLLEISAAMYNNLIFPLGKVLMQLAKLICYMIAIALVCYDVLQLLLVLLTFPWNLMVYIILLLLGPI